MTIETRTSGRTDTGSESGDLVSVEGVEKTFRRGSEEIRVLAGLNLRVPRGEFLAMMGPSGSGKTTLLNLIGGLDRPTRGSVAVGGDRLETLSSRRLAAWRAQHVGLVCDECAAGHLAGYLLDDLTDKGGPR